MDDSGQVPREAARSTGRALMRALSSPFWAGRRSLARLAGVTFGGKRDTYESLGYQRILLPRDYRARYKRGGIAARIVEALPMACWRGGGKIFEDDGVEDDDTQFEQKWKDLNKRLNIWQVFQRADILAGLGRYSIILIGAPGNLDTELTSCTADEIKYLVPYGEEDAKIIEYDQDYKSDRFARPVKYSLTRQWQQWPGQMNPPAVPAVNVHYSRVIHIPDGLLDDNVFGKPRLEACWNLLDDLDKVIGGGSESFWKRADGGTQFEIDPELAFDPDPTTAAAERAAMQQKFDDFTHELKKNITTRGIKINRMGSDVADMRGPAAAIMDQISATIGMPQRVLMGSELGKLASSKDKSNWDDRVQDRRDSFCAPIVVRPFIDRLVELGALVAPKEDYDVDWPISDEMDQTQRVAAASTVAQVNKNAGTQIVTDSELRTIYLGLAPLTDDQKKEIEKKKAQDARDAADRFEQQQQLAIVSKTGSPISKTPETGVDLKAAMDIRALEEALLEDDFDLAEKIVERALGSISRPRTKRVEYERIEGILRPARIIEEGVA